MGILISETEAAERAGRCAADAGLKDTELDGMELLGHELGYLWAVFYALSVIFFRQPIRR